MAAQHVAPGNGPTSVATVGGLLLAERTREHRRRERNLPMTAKRPHPVSCFLVAPVALADEVDVVLLASSKQTGGSGARLRSSRTICCQVRTRIRPV